MNAPVEIYFNAPPPPQYYAPQPLQITSYDVAGLGYNAGVLGASAAIGAATVTGMAIGTVAGGIVDLFSGGNRQEYYYAQDEVPEMPASGVYGVSAPNPLATSLAAGMPGYEKLSAEQQMALMRDLQAAGMNQQVMASNESLTEFLKSNEAVFGKYERLETAKANLDDMRTAYIGATAMAELPMQADIRQYQRITDQQQPMYMSWGENSGRYGGLNLGRFDSGYSAANGESVEAQAGGDRSPSGVERS